MSRDDRAASAVEYGLMLAAITGLIMALVFGFGFATRTLFSDTVSCFSAGTAATC